jgi:lipopolysaccharide transport system ATP-binding protein
MIPQFTEIYPTQGARIDSIKIYNSQGQEVNNLLAGIEYNFEFCVTFLEEREAIYLVFGIRSTQGMTMTSYVYPDNGQYIYGVKIGQKYRLIYRLKMNLTPNTYFSGGGVWSTTEPVCMHRIVDAIMFRVLPKTGKRVLGYVDLAVGEPEFEIVEM